MLWNPCRLLAPIPVFLGLRVKLKQGLAGTKEKPTSSADGDSNSRPVSSNPVGGHQAAHRENSNGLAPMRLHQAEPRSRQSSVISRQFVVAALPRRGLRDKAPDGKLALFVEISTW